MKKLVLSLCDHSGTWSKPYADDPDYEVICVDLLEGLDVRLLRRIDHPVHGILAAPPCTHFAVAGASSWRSKGDAAVIEGMSAVDACLRAVVIYRPAWWALENPVGRLDDYLGPYAWKFDPCEYGGWLAEGEKSWDCDLLPPNDAYTKLSCIWGTAAKPEPKPVPAPKPFAGVPRLRGGNRWNNRCFKRHQHHRSVTPLGFARAFKQSNP